MIRNLYLVRHAKTHQESIDNRDFSRELNDRGYRDASIVGAYCKDHGCLVDMMITSPAARALSTAELMASQLNYDAHSIHTNEELYMASVRTFLIVVNQLKDDWQNVMLVSHNPTVTYLAEHLSNAEMGNMPTGAVVKIKFDLPTWAEVSQNTGTVDLYVTPKMIKENLT